MDAIDARIAAKFADVQRDRDAMHGYQSGLAVPFMRQHPMSLVCMDMGLGKTISSLTVIADLISENIGEKILVIAPLRVATDTWPSEIGTWQHLAWMNHCLIREDGRRRKEDCVSDPASIHIINREQVEWLVYFWKDLWPYRTVIIDESSSFKDHNSKRFKALAKVRRTPGLIRRMHLLTATPAAETYEHLWAQVYLLDLGQRFGKGITRYRDTYFNYNKYSMKYKLRGGQEEVILGLIADITLVMKSKDYLPRTEPTVIQRKVRLSQHQLDLVKALERDFLMTLPDGTELEAKTAAMLAGMLLQMASGSVYETKLEGDWETEDLKKVKKVHHLHTHKIDALREMYEEAQTQGEPLLVAYYFQSSLAMLKKAFPKATVMDKEGKCIKAWNAGKIPLLFIHPMSAGHGLNLQHGGHILIFFDLIYSLEYYLQTIGRLDRQGQKNPVIVEMLVAEGTRDELVFECLRDKKDAQEKMFTTLKRMIKKLRDRVKPLG